MNVGGFGDENARARRAIQMKSAWILLLLLPSILLGQSAVPAGTVLPLRLDTGLNASKVKAGQEIRARIMQDIPGTQIHRGAHVQGHVLNATPARLELRFDTLIANRQHMALTTDLRALASFMEVESAQIPESGPDRATPPSDYTTSQIGGEQVYRGGGPVARGITTVAEPTPYGARGQLHSNPPCRAAIAGNDRPQAFWLFSTDACGVYGIYGLTIEHAGRTNPVGTIALVSKTGKLNIRSGSGLLLRVQPLHAGTEGDHD